MELTLIIKFKIKINIYKEKEYHLNGFLAVVLTEDETITFGRNLIRKCEYDEKYSETILFTEDDPLARVSNSQITLKLKNGDMLSNL